SFFLLFGADTIDVLFRRGALDVRAADRSGTLLAAFSLALLGSMLLVMLARVFYAIGYFRAVVWTQVWALVVYAVLALPLRAAWGTTGLAIAFGIAETSAGAYAVVLAGRRSRLKPRTALTSAVLPALLRVLPIAAALGGVRLAAGALGGHHPLARVAIGLAAGGVVGIAVLWQSGWPEVGPVKRRLRRLYTARATP
ncbi:MAG TPA: lipid II flippase MurJ, partial [Gaiellaceae bacterium]|nr:lipid II flippase MurJ [Gaiellaceae bacterium]